MSSEAALADLHRYLDAKRDHGTVASLTHQWLHERSTRSGQSAITPDLLHAIDEMRFNPQWQESGTPQGLVTFIGKLAAMHKVETVLDPTCGRGLLLHEVSVTTQAKVVHGIEINLETADIAHSVLGDRATIFRANAILPPAELLARYDLIVAHPPLNAHLNLPVKLPRLGERKFDDLGLALAAWGCSRLTEQGHVVLILSPSFLWSARGRDMLAAVHSLGCRVGALFHLPGGSLANTSIASYIVLLEHGPQQDVFIGEFAGKSDQQAQLLSNYKRRKSGEQPGLGRICSLDTFRGFDSFVAQERLKRLAKASGWKPQPADAVLLNPRKLTRAEGHTDPSPNSFYLKMVGRGKAVLNRADFSLGSAQEVLQIEINPEVADARYLVHWFNQSQVGRSTLEVAKKGSVIPRIDRLTLFKSDLYLPPLAEQREILKGVEHLKKVRAEAAELEEVLCSGTGETNQLVQQIQTINQEDRYEDWIESLPFPLASVLWRHHASGGAHREKFEVLLHFFEATAAFVATVHLSALMSDDGIWSGVGHGLHERLKKQHLSLDRATFGAWKLAVEYLASQCKKLLDGENGEETCRRLYGTSNLSDIGMICKPELLGTLQRANAIRNQTTGHGGAIGPEDAKRIHEELRSLVDSLRGVFGRSWRDYELIQPAEGRYSGGVHSYQAKRMMGTRSAPFEMVQRESLQPLESDRLYLFDAMSQRGLLLRPFIQVMPSPQKKAMACFIFSRSEPGGAHFVSYHFDQESSLTAPFPDVDETFRRIHQFDEGAQA
jgi:hypothetical protein